MRAATGQNLLALATGHIGERYVLGSHAPKDNAQWRGPWDCAEFASWLVYQVAGQLYGCANNKGVPRTADAYTGYWARDAAAIGAKISVAEAARTPGAFLLRVPKKGVTGHIAISDGAGGTVEAHSTKRGVIRAKTAGRRWDFGILPPCVDYKSAG